MRRRLRLVVGIIMKIIASLSRGLMAALLVNAFAATMLISCFAQQNSALRAYPAGNWGTQTFLCENGFPAESAKAISRF